MVACSLLAERADERSAELLADSLDDVNREVRSAAATGLASMGEVGVLAAQPSVGSIRQWTADSREQPVDLTEATHSAAHCQEQERQD